MTDFMRWLYAKYVWPYLTEQDQRGYETPLSLMDTCLDNALKKEYRRTLEFYTGHAFLLGLRTGAGLGEVLRVPAGRREHLQRSVGADIIRPHQKGSRTSRAGG